MCMYSVYMYRVCNCTLPLSFSGMDPCSHGDDMLRPLPDNGSIGVCISREVVYIIRTGTSTDWCSSLFIINI